MGLDEDTKETLKNNSGLVGTGLVGTGIIGMLAMIYSQLGDLEKIGAQLTAELKSAQVDIVELSEFKNSIDARVRVLEIESAVQNHRRDKANEGR